MTRIANLTLTLRPGVRVSLVPEAGDLTPADLVLAGSIIHATGRLRQVAERNEAKHAEEKP